MNTLTKTALVLLAAALLLGVGGVCGWYLTKGKTAEKPAAQPETATVTSEKSLEILYWYDPMMPQQHFDKPGKSPFMDMQLIPKYAEADMVSGLKIDSQILENIGIRLAKVSRITLSRKIVATGRIGLDERNLAVVQARTGGYVERVWPLAPGDKVTAGQPLAEILTPDWISAQQEMLALKSYAEPELLNAARERLRLLGMPETFITQLEHSGKVQPRLTVTAPLAGVIQELDVRNGMTIASGQTLARINGLDKVWLEVAVPEAQSDSLQLGDQAEIRLSAFPQQTLTGAIALILPILNENSRSVRIRIELNNPSQALRPGMSAQVSLNSKGSESGLAIPTEALIRTGKRTLVMLAESAGRFSPVEVTIGHEIGDQTQIIAGLEADQQIVSSGQFLLDSEASLSGIEARSKPARHQQPLDSSQ